MNTVHFHSRICGVEDQQRAVQAMKEAWREIGASGHRGIPYLDIEGGGYCDVVHDLGTAIEEIVSTPFNNTLITIHVQHEDPGGIDVNDL